MAATSVEPPGAGAHDHVHSAFEALRAGFSAEPFPEHRVRAAWLRHLRDAVRGHSDAIVAAISADFGHRSRHETLSADVYPVVAHARFVLAQLRAWMAPEPRPVSLPLQPGRARVVPQPKGVVGVISPWNYPLQLALVPAIYALAAGNRVLIKPSEHTPRTSALIRELVALALPADVARVVEGGPDVGGAFAALPLDHLMFTGSERVGRQVLAAAAANLTPVTLELGGKSPALVLPDADLATTAFSIAAAKLFNAGQTCVAPDYALVLRSQADDLVARLQAEVVRMVPSLQDNPDYTSIIDERAVARLQRTVDDARARGATVIRLDPAGEALRPDRFPPTLIRNPTDDMRVMQEEIFGPILPIVEVDGVDDAIRYVQARPRPLALYLFDRRTGRAEDVIRRTHSGGVGVNECFMQALAEALPLGGIGASGMGQYHGKEGFDAFSHRKAVFYQARWNLRALSAPPFGRALERLLGWFL